MRFLPAPVHSSCPSDAGFRCYWNEYSRKNRSISSSEDDSFHNGSIIAVLRSTNLTIVENVYVALPEARGLRFHRGSFKPVL